MAAALRFYWDRANTCHIASHWVAPEEVQQVFENDEMGVDYDVVQGEDRWTDMGETDNARVLIVVCTMRADQVRVVTDAKGE